MIANPATITVREHASAGSDNPLGLLSVDQVRRMLSVGGKVKSRDRVYSWVRQGVRVNGRVVKLRCVRLPREMAFFPRDVEAFLSELASSQTEDDDAGRRGRGGAASRRVEFRRCAPHEIGTHPPISGPGSAPMTSCPGPS